MIKKFMTVKASFILGAASLAISLIALFTAISNSHDYANRNINISELEDKSQNPESDNKLQNVEIVRVGNETPQLESHDNISTIVPQEGTIQQNQNTVDQKLKANESTVVQDVKSKQSKNELQIIKKTEKVKVVQKKQDIKKKNRFVAQVGSFANEALAKSNCTRISKHVPKGSSCVPHKAKTGNKNVVRSVVKFENKIDANEFCSNVAKSKLPCLVMAIGK